MSQSNYKVKIFNKLLITCSFLSLLVGEVNAAAGFSDVFEDDADVQKALSGNVRDVLKEKAVKKRSSYKLSDKGDLRTNHGQVFREFFMKADGNCSLYAMGTNHAEAKALFLANAQNQIVRDLAHQEIVDEFHNLPPEMQAKQNYIELKNSLTTIQDLLSAATEIGPRANLIRQEDQVRQQIGDYAKLEETYRDYVNHVLVDGHHMRFRQDVGGNRGTYFIDALAHLLNKDLMIWSQVDSNGVIIEEHPGRIRNDTHLILSHYYWDWGHVSSGTLNIIHRGDHFNRLVLPFDDSALSTAAQDEEQAVSVNALAVLSYGLQKNNKLIEYHLNERIVNGNQFSEVDKREARAKIADLEKQRGSGKKPLRTKRISPKELKAYSIAFVKGAKLVKEDLRKDAEINIEQAKARINLRYPANLRASNAGARQLFNKAMQDVEKLAPKKAAAIAEIQRIDRQISLLEKVSNSINETVSEDNIFAALSATIFSIGHENEALEELITRERTTEPNEEVAQFEKQVKENLATKKIFEKLYSVYEKENRENVRKRLQFNLNQSKKRLETWLGKNQILDTSMWPGWNSSSISLADDFRVAKSVLDSVAQQRRQQNALYLNPDYIIHDPYLLTHNKDVDGLQQINDSEWREFKQDVEKEVSNYLRTNKGIDAATRQDTQESLHMFERVLSKVDIGPMDQQGTRKHTLRKRIKRILDTLISQADEGDQARLSAYARFARLMTQNDGRCIDGVETAVDDIEQVLIYSGDGGNFTEHKFAEHTISKILTSDKHNFIQQHQAYGEDNEARTAIPLLLLQRMRYSLSLRGEPTNIAYPSIGRPDAPDLQPVKVMERYLQGGQHLSLQGRRTIFEARTPERLVSLLYNAYEQGLNKITNQGPTFSNQELVDFALSDVKMKPLFQEFCEAFDDGKMRTSNYFEVRKNPSTGKIDLIGYKRAFFEYMLKRLGYIIDPRDPSINILPSQKPILIPVKVAPPKPVVTPPKVVTPAKPVVVTPPKVVTPAKPVVVTPAKPAVRRASRNTVPARKPAAVSVARAALKKGAPARKPAAVSKARTVSNAAPAKKPAAVQAAKITSSAVSAGKPLAVSTAAKKTAPTKKPTAVSRVRKASRNAVPERKPAAASRARIASRAAPAKKPATAQGAKITSRKAVPARKPVKRSLSAKVAPVKRGASAKVAPPRKAPPQRSRFVKGKAKVKSVGSRISQRRASVRVPVKRK
ncbi:MAG: hypothetical protein K2Y08_02945 [Alphaproteobacteria bacterium]|nr:hypothetical protein [Alphaproteobacteria bacterium]